MSGDTGPIEVIRRPNRVLVLRVDAVPQVEVKVALSITEARNLAVALLQAADEAAVGL